MYSQANFHLARGVDRAGDSAEGRITGKAQAAWITRLKMVEDIGELEGESGANAFRELKVLGQRCIHVPPIQTSQISHAAATRVNAEYAAPEVCIHRGRVAKQVHPARIVCAHINAHASQDHCRAGNAEVRRVPANEWGEWNGALKGAARTR